MKGGKEGNVIVSCLYNDGVTSFLSENNVINHHLISSWMKYSLVLAGIIVDYILTSKNGYFVFIIIMYLSSIGGRLMMLSAQLLTRVRRY